MPPPSTAAETRREKVAAAHTAVQRDLAASQVELAATEERRQRSAQHVTALSNELSRLKSQAAEARRDTDSEQDRFATLQRQAEVLAAEVHALEKDRNQLMEVRREVEAETEALASARSQLRSLEAQVEAANEAARGARSDARAVDGQVARANAELTEMRLAVERRRRELDEVSGLGGASVLALSPWLTPLPTRAPGGCVARYQLESSLARGKREYETVQVERTAAERAVADERHRREEAEIDSRRARQELDHVRDQINIVQRQLEVRVPWGAATKPACTHRRVVCPPLQESTVHLKRTRQQHLLATQELQQVKRDIEEERGRLETAKVQSRLAVDEASNLRIQSARFGDHASTASSSPGTQRGGFMEMEATAVGGRMFELRASLGELEKRVSELRRECTSKVRCAPPCLFAVTAWQLMASPVLVSVCARVAVCGCVYDVM